MARRKHPKWDMDMRKTVALGLGVVVLGVVLLALLGVQDGYRQRQASFASSPRGQLLSMLKITRPCVNDVYRTADATEAAAKHVSPLGGNGESISGGGATISQKQPAAGR